MKIFAPLYETNLSTNAFMNTAALPMLETSGQHKWCACQCASGIRKRGLKELATACYIQILI
jgi:hypothetical protein